MKRFLLILSVLAFSGSLFAQQETVEMRFKRSDNHIFGFKWFQEATSSIYQEDGWISIRNLNRNRVSITPSLLIKYAGKGYVITPDMELIRNYDRLESFDMTVNSKEFTITLWEYEQNTNILTAQIRFFDGDFSYEAQICSKMDDIPTYVKLFINSVNFTK